MTSLGLNIRSKSISERYSHQKPVYLKVKEARIHQKDHNSGDINLTLSTVNRNTQQTSNETPVQSNPKMTDSKYEGKSDLMGPLSSDINKQLSQYPHLMSFRSTYIKDSTTISSQKELNQDLPLTKTEQFSTIKL